MGSVVFSLPTPTIFRRGEALENEIASPKLDAPDAPSILESSRESGEARQTMPLTRLIAAGLQSDPTFFNAKFEDFRSFNATTAVLLSLVAALLWVCDYAADPTAASHTIILRALFPLMAAPYVAAMLLGKSVRISIALWYGALLGAQAIYVQILAQLGHGVVGSSEGFMFFLLVPFLMTGSFTLRVNLLAILILSDWPLVLSLAGAAPGLDWAHYCVVVWPAAGLTAFGVCMFSYVYRANYDYQHQLEIAANTDALTGAANRRRFGDALIDAINRSRRYPSPLSVVLLDIDHFKRINDRWGHATGDRAIKHVVETCRLAVREVDLVGRMGGEEFAILLPQTNGQAAVKAAARVRELLHERPFESDDGTSIKLRCSLGVASYRMTDPGPDAVLRRADIGLYKAKSTGRDRVVDFSLA